MKIYVASPFDRWPYALGVCEDLIRAGHTITRQWWDFEKADGQIATEERRTEIATADYEAVVAADAVVALAFPGEGCGMWTEIGIALGRAIPVFLVNGLDPTQLPPQRSVFETLMSLTSTEDLVGILQERP